VTPAPTRHRRMALRKRLQARRLVLPAKTGGSVFVGEGSVRVGCDEIADFRRGVELLRRSPHSRKVVPQSAS
jgi:hypothetical protein